MLLKLQARKQQSILTLPTVEPLSTSGKKTVIFLRLPIIKAKRALRNYKNIEKLLPFYNKAAIVKYESGQWEQSLYPKRTFLSAVMMKDNKSSQTLFPTNKLQTNSC